MNTFKVKQQLVNLQSSTACDMAVVAVVVTVVVVVVVAAATVVVVALYSKLYSIRNPLYSNFFKTAKVSCAKE